MQHHNTQAEELLFPHIAQQLVNDILVFQEKSHEEIAAHCRMNHDIVMQVSHGDFSKLSDSSFGNLLRLYQTLFPQSLICSDAPTDLV